MKQFLPSIVLLTIYFLYVHELTFKNVTIYIFSCIGFIALILCIGYIITFFATNSLILKNESLESKVDELLKENQRLESKVDELSKENTMSKYNWDGLRKEILRLENLAYHKKHIKIVQ